MEDLRIAFSLIGHPKLEKLKLLIGDQALERLVSLWIRVAQNRPRGNLKDLDNIDISLYAGWKGNPDEFVDALIKCKWIKDNGNGLEIQDWKEHQPWVYYAPERSEKAKQAALKRWEHKYCAKGMPDACDPHNKRNAPSPNPNPTPNPIPKNNQQADFFKNKLSSYFESIEKTCKILKTIKPQKDFNPFAFVNKSIKSGIHPGAVDEILKSMVLYWEKIESPWAYSKTAIKKLNGNYWEKDHQKDHEQIKQACDSFLKTNKEIMRLVKGIGK